MIFLVQFYSAVCCKKFLMVKGMILFCIDIFVQGNEVGLRVQTVKQSPM